MSSKKFLYQYLLRPFSSNGDSSTDDEDENDDVFVNSRLDVMPRNCDLIDPNLDAAQYDPKLFLDLKMDLSPSLYSPSPKGINNAVIFSVYVCGKYFGELGLFDPDVSILDWIGFKSYIFSSLNIDNCDSFVISYCDEDGDKISIESEEGYQGALKIAKSRANDEEKLSIYVTRIGGGVSRTLRSLMASSLFRVNSVTGSTGTAGSTLPGSQMLKKDVTTSTSFYKLDNTNQHDTVSRKDSPPLTLLLNDPGHNLNDLGHNSYDPGLMNDPIFEKSLFDCLPDAPQPFGEPRSWAAYSTSYPGGPVTQNSWEGSQESGVLPQSSGVFDGTPPKWFAEYMKQFRDDLSQEVCSKIDERFDQVLGNISTTEIETKIKNLLTDYGSTKNVKPDNPCYCRVGLSFNNTGFSKESDRERIGIDELEREFLSTPMAGMTLGHSDDPIVDSEDFNSQDYFLHKLLKREQEILDFLDNTNERIKEKIKVSDDYTDSLRSCLTKDLPIESRDRVLARIEDFRRRQNRTNIDIKLLQESMKSNAENISRLSLRTSQLITQSSDASPLMTQSSDAALLMTQLRTPVNEYDAKFVKDESFPDGSKLLPQQCFTKHWAVQNMGLQPWDEQSFLVCQSFLHMEPYNEKIPCPHLGPGQVGRISADFQAPLRPGLHTTEWRFIRDGKYFGNHLWCSVVVPSQSDLATANIESVQKDDATLSSGHVPPFVDDDFSVSEETCVMQGKEALRRLSSEQLLRYILYVIRICRPELKHLKNSSEYKSFYNCLFNVTDADLNELRVLTDGVFLRSCARRGLASDEMIRLYEHLFRPDEYEPFNEPDVLLHSEEQFGPCEAETLILPVNELNQPSSSQLLGEGTPKSEPDPLHSVIDDQFDDSENDKADDSEDNDSLVGSDDENIDENAPNSLDNSVHINACNEDVTASVKENGVVYADENDETFYRVDDNDFNDNENSISSCDESSLDESASLSSEHEIENDVTEDNEGHETPVSYPIPGEATSALSGNHRATASLPLVPNPLGNSTNCDKESVPNSRLSIESTLQKTFKQNVQVDLDFEIIPTRCDGTREARELNLCLPPSAPPLTFQERHFTLSHRPPPEPVQAVPDSDDESVGGGLVFIKDTDISSAPSTGPCSPLTPRRTNLLDTAELSVSCSSFSECDGEDTEDADNLNDVTSASDISACLGDAANDIEDGSVSTDVCFQSESSPSHSSVIVDEASSTCLESTLSDDEFDKIDIEPRNEVDDQVLVALIKSPDEAAVAESGSSTTPTSITVKEDGPSSRSSPEAPTNTESYDEGSRNCEETSTFDSAFEEPKG